LISALQQIRQGCAQLGAPLTPLQLQQLADLIVLLEKWNAAYNLTAIRDPAQMVPRHLLDSLAVLPWLRDGSLLDVGSGAGLPGLPLAIALPGQRFTLLDANAKKVRFIRQATAELGLRNVAAVHVRMQEYQPGHAFDMVISRAVASIDQLYRQAAHLLAPGGRMLFMKGALPEDEMAAFTPCSETLHSERLQVPGLDARRHLLWLDKQG
jgi:16S rRNA (guanine527-N7)-methyltransferase